MRYRFLILFVSVLASTLVVVLSWFRLSNSKGTTSKCWKKCACSDVPHRSDEDEDAAVDDDNVNQGGINGSDDLLCVNSQQEARATIKTCPKRLQRAAHLVQRMNSWHFHMINDVGRNEFYWHAMQGAVQGKRVFVLGSGSALLDIIAAKHGATHVDGVEGSKEFRELAVKNVERNGFADIVQVHHKVSTDFKYATDGRADVLVTEIFGLSLLRENVVEYVEDARLRLLKPGARVIPAGGTECVTLLQSRVLWQQHSAGKWRDIDLSLMNVYTNTYSAGWSDDAFNLHSGFRFTKWQAMAPRVELYKIDFETITTQDFPFKGAVRVIATETGPVHALVVSWEVFAKSDHRFGLNTHLDGVYEGDEEARWHHNRHWGQLYQLVAEEPQGDDRWGIPQEFTVQKGEELLVVWECHVTGLHHLHLERAAGPSPGLE